MVEGEVGGELWLFPLTILKTAMVDGRMAVGRGPWEGKKMNPLIVQRN